MKVIEKYTGQKTYMFPNGAIATPEVIEAQFPAVNVFPHIIETDEHSEVCFAVQNLSAMRSFYEVDASLDESEAIAKIQEIINSPAPEPVSSPVSSPEERQAAALEAIASGATGESTEVINALLGEEV